MLLLHVPRETLKRFATSDAVTYFSSSYSIKADPLLWLRLLPGCYILNTNLTNGLIGDNSILIVPQSIRKVK
jgi:hypothetical protein